MARRTQDSTRSVLITGGAGFVGSNLAARLLREGGAEVTVLDNLSRRGVRHNLEWLRSLPESRRLTLIEADVRDQSAITAAVRYADEIYHLAAQVAVTTAVRNPRDDFEVNALGTFNVLEAARASGKQPMLLFTSTNKVYGGLCTVPVEPRATRYCASDTSFQGATEETPLDFHSPYGCSKGAADQYVRDYARIYQLPTVVFRMSCIAGPRQLGNEDQGWVAHFLYSALAGRSINIYGTGLQVRDVLHVEDLIDAMQAARQNLATTAGEVYNVGGGPTRATSVLETLGEIQRLTGKTCRLQHFEERPGDQPLYVSNISKLTSDTGWQPQRSFAETLKDIQEFWLANRELIENNFADSATAGMDVTAGVEEFVTEEVA